MIATFVNISTKETKEQEVKDSLEALKLCFAEAEKESKEGNTCKLTTYGRHTFYFTVINPQKQVVKTLTIRTPGID